MAKSNHTGKFLTGLVFGGLAGMAAAILYAPQSGDETRRMIRNSALDAKVRAGDTLRQAQEQVGRRFDGVQERVNQLAQDAVQTTRTRTEQLKQVGNKTIQEGKANLETSLDEAQDILNT